MKILIKKADENLISELNIKSWPVWKSPVTEFSWHHDSDETCLFIEGEVLVKSDMGEVKISAGDIVVFPKGLDSIWKVIKPVAKHYSFEDLKANLFGAE